MSTSAAGERPVPTNAAKERIHAFAEHVAEQLHLGPGDSLEPVVARLGGKILYHSPVAWIGIAPESISVESLRDFTIYIPTTTSPQRDRFTIAHELGHLFLHYPMVQKAHPGARMVATRWVDLKDAVQQRAEWEANWFAAAFLMPETSFRQRWASDPGAAAIAVAFGVSEQAAAIRAKSLALK